jgi:molecular chaperone DnaK
VTVHVLQGEREKALYNKSLGQFNLEGINPAPRGIPQIEVKFDIDANGILNVSAKDKVTGKEQSVVIKASSGLSEAEIERMVKEAETHAEEDRQFHELVSARNQGEALLHATHKSLKEIGEKLEPAEKERIEGAVKDLEKAIKGEDKDQIEAKSKALSEASSKITEKLHAQNNSTKEEAARHAGHPEDNVVDAEFEDVSNDK